MQDVRAVGGLGVQDRLDVFQGIAEGDAPPLVRCFGFDVPDVLFAVLAGDLFLRVVLCLQLAEPLEEVLELGLVFVGVDDVGGGDGLEYMIVLFVDGVLM